jgi:hypothetical protein
MEQEACLRSRGHDTYLDAAADDGIVSSLLRHRASLLSEQNVRVALYLLSETAPPGRDEQRTDIGDGALLRHGAIVDELDKLLSRAGISDQHEVSTHLRILNWFQRTGNSSFCRLGCSCEFLDTILVPFLLPFFWIFMVSFAAHRHQLRRRRVYGHHQAPALRRQRTRRPLHGRGAR